MKILSSKQKKHFSKDEHLIYKTILNFDKIKKTVSLKPKGRQKVKNLLHRHNLKHSHYIKHIDGSPFDMIYQTKTKGIGVPFKIKMIKLKKTNTIIYNTLTKINGAAGVIYTEKYLSAYLEEHRLNFDDLIN